MTVFCQILSPWWLRFHHLVYISCVRFIMDQARESAHKSSLIIRKPGELATAMTQIDQRTQTVVETEEAGELRRCRNNHVPPATSLGYALLRLVLQLSDAQQCPQRALSLHLLLHSYHITSCREFECTPAASIEHSSGVTRPLGAVLRRSLSSWHACARPAPNLYDSHFGRLLHLTKDHYSNKSPISF